MFRPKFTAIFRDLVSVLTCTAYVVTYAEALDYIRPCLNIIKILKSQLTIKYNIKLFELDVANCVVSRHLLLIYIQLK
jgi:hypothetical protein